MIYLDCNSTTHLATKAKEAMIACMDKPLNPSSVHSFGRDAKQLLLAAKESIASLLSINPDEIFFTSGGTESMNMLIKGLYPGHGKILTTDLEHPCITETLKSMKLGKDQIIYVSPKSYGAPQLKDLEPHINENISLIVLSAVYSETGAMLDLEKFAAFAEMLNIPLVIDGVALLGKQVFRIPNGVRGMGFSAHKLHGPMGVGAAYISSCTSFKPSIFGGAQQMGNRAGTENIPAIVGFQKALELAYESFPSSTKHMLDIQELFKNELSSLDQTILINGEGPKICNTLNVYFEDTDGEALLIALDRAGISASLGSACSSGSLQPSTILMNMGYDSSRAKNSLRFSWSRYTTISETKKALHTICETLLNLRSFTT